MARVLGGGNGTAVVNGHPVAVARPGEAATVWIDGALDADEPIPSPSSREVVRGSSKYRGWMIGVIALDEALSDDTIEPMNLTLS